MTSLNDRRDKSTRRVRQVLLDRLTVLFGLGLVISLPALWVLDSNVFLPALFLLVFVALSLLRTAPYSIRVVNLVALFVALGVLVVISRAEPLGGRLWIVIAAAVATVLMGFRYGVVTLIIGSVLIFLPYYWFHFDTGPAHPHFIDDPRDWLVQVFTGFVPGIILIYATSFAFDRLVKTESQAQLVAENAVDIIWSVDMDQNYTFVTPSVEVILGYSVDEMLAMKSYQLVTEETVEVIRKELNEALSQQNRTGQTLEYEMIKKDGTHVWTENSFRFMYDADGNVIGISGVTRDISERKEAEATQQALESQLLQSQKMESIGQLAGGIAHDFNNLLSVIIGNTELIQKTTMSQAETDACVDDIRKASDSAKSISQQLLTFSRNDPVSLQPTDVNSLILELSTLLERLLPANVSLRLELEPGIPTAYCDSTMIEQTLVNLVVNARDAIDGEGKIAVTTSQQQFSEGDQLLSGSVKPGQFISISVRDTGCGIPTELHDKIFEPFFTSKASGQGTGLGLSVIFGIVKQHDGFIHLESAPDLGSSFTLYLPIAAQDLESEKPKQTEKITGGRETILLVEDDPAIRKLCKNMLTKAGYSVLDSSNAQEACDLLEQKPDEIELVFSDLLMPGMTGMELAAYVKNNHPGLPVMLTSGNTSGIETTGYTVLRKPYGSSELLAAVRQVLDKATA